MGTVQVIERANSRSWNIAQKGTECSVTCTYLASWLPSGASDPYPGEGTIFIDANFPKPTTRAPSSLHAGDPYVKQMICRTVTMAPETSRPYTWQVQATYTSNANPYSTGVYARLTKSASERTLGQYRDFSSIPTNGTASWPPGDMGGTKLDLHGTPRPLSVSQETITLEYLHDRTTSSTSTVNDPDWYTFGLEQGTRNSVAMFNGTYSVGTLLYKGCQATLEQETWRLVHVWLFDNYKHLEQITCPNPTGQPTLAATGSFDGVTGFMQATKVGWYQRYPTLRNHLSMLPAVVQTELTSAYPAVAP